MIGRPRIWLFVGPSLAADDLARACASIDGDVEVFPPIQQGDLLGNASHLPDVVGIIDGYFFHAPSVTHKEILFAIEQGVNVLGASSLGALRAAELDVFGMEGVGDVYRLYKRGTIDADDEVAVVHGEASDGYRLLSEPLVNIRHNLAVARRRGIISASTAAAGLASVRSLHFSQRSHAAVLLGVPDADPEELASLQAFLEHEAVDLKRRDALSLVRLIAERVAGTRPWPPAPALTVRRTVFLHLLRRQYADWTTCGERVRETLVVSLHKLLCPSIPALVRGVARRNLAVDEAHARGIVPAPSADLEARFCESQLPPEPDLTEWRRRNHLLAGELHDVLRDRDLEARLLADYQRDAPGRGPAGHWRQLRMDVSRRTGLSQRSLSGPLYMRPGVPWEEPLVREMKFRGQFGPALELAGRIVSHGAHVAERLPGLRSALADERLEQWFCARWAVPASNIDRALMARGITDYQEFLEAASLAYLYENLGGISAIQGHRGGSDC